MTVHVDIKKLQVRYGSHIAIDDLTLSLAPAKIYGLLGRNGSGKTTLLSVLAAFRKASAGEVRIDGQPVFENSAVMRRICFIGAGKSLLDSDENIHETLNTIRYLRPMWDETYAHELLKLFQLPTNKKVGELSLGQQSTLGVIIGLASRAPLTIFDESYLGMDAPARMLFHDELLADFMANPRTIILSTHLVEELSTLFEEVIMIDKGRLLLHENTEALRARGLSLTGAAEVVDRFAQGLRVLGERHLGRTKSVTVYGALDERQQVQAQQAGVEVASLRLQELFTHLTYTTEHSHES